jgi:ATP-dependent DNA ligase
MLTFYPDKPYMRAPQELDEWQKSGEYVCEAKMDGWRIILLFEEDGVHAVTRRGNEQYSAEVNADFHWDLQALRGCVPVGSQLDAEWCKRRCVELGLPPRLYVFDSMRWDGEWLINAPLSRRQSLVMDAMRGFEGDVRFIERAPSERPWSEFYESLTKRPETEGVVVKALRSKLVADRRRSHKNSSWFKVKYREI